MDIIKVENTSYAKYEEVLLRRDNLRKEAEQYQLDFIKTFGDLITESFQLKIECIKKKKMITFCQRQMNQGKDISSAALTAYIEKEMASYQKELDEMLRDVQIARSAGTVTDAELRKIKKIYYALVKLIHPDMHPELSSDETLKGYWNRIVIAYTHNDLDELQALDSLVRMYLTERALGTDCKHEIENLEEKIEKVEHDIDQIVSTNPYLYRLLLADPDEIEEKKHEYRDEIDAYTKYSAELDEVLSAFEIKEMFS